jgi:hypothetical protein
MLPDAHILGKGWYSVAYIYERSGTSNEYTESNFVVFLCF